MYIFNICKFFKNLHIIYLYIISEAYIASLIFWLLLLRCYLLKRFLTFQHMFAERTSAS